MKCNYESWSLCIIMNIPQVLHCIVGQMTDIKCSSCSSLFHYHCIVVYTSDILQLFKVQEYIKSYQAQKWTSLYT